MCFQIKLFSHSLCTIHFSVCMMIVICSDICHFQTVASIQKVYFCIYLMSQASFIFLSCRYFSMIITYKITLVLYFPTFCIDDASKHSMTWSCLCSKQSPSSDCLECLLHVYRFIEQGDNLQGVDTQVIDNCELPWLTWGGTVDRFSIPLFLFHSYFKEIPPITCWWSFAPWWVLSSDWWSKGSNHWQFDKKKKKEDYKLIPEVTT